MFPVKKAPGNSGSLYLISLLIIFLSGSGIVSSCIGTSSSAAEQASDVWKPDTTGIHTMNVEMLSEVYCGGCHLYPEPTLLPKKIWTESVLPEMAHRLGLNLDDQNPYNGMSMEEIFLVSSEQVYPDDSLISTPYWNQIFSFYQQQAPDTLSTIADNQDRHVIDSSLFHPQTSTYPLNKIPLTTLIEIIDDNILYLGDGRSNLYKIHLRNPSIDSLQLDSPPTDLVRSEDGFTYILTSGVFRPSDQRKGRLYAWHPQTRQLDTLLTGLPRPVHLDMEDLNGDGIEDFIVCGFGYRTGYLAWYERDQQGQLTPHILNPNPGALQTQIMDVNQDQLPDIVVLMAQGNEGVHAYINQGKGQFERETWLRFPSVWGSSSFTLYDWNRDGLPDIICTHGDNADYSPIIKPYHGIRIYLNRGDFQFENAFFYHLPGAYQAIPHDYDQDGDTDLAAISFFPSFDSEDHKSWIFMENTATSDTIFQFTTYSKTQANQGRWLVMSSGDIDIDGDMDLLLGSFVFAPTPVPESIQQNWEKKGVGLMIFENMTHD